MEKSEKLKSILEKIWQYREIIYIVVVVLLCILLLNRCSAYNGAQNEIKRQQNNIEAMTDSLTYYVDELGRVNGEKHAYQLTQKELEDSIGKLDKKHREYVSYLKSKLSLRDTFYVESVIDRPVRDTNYLDNGIIKLDTTSVFGKSSLSIVVQVPFVVDSLLRTGKSDITVSQDIFVEGWLERDTKTGETFIRLRSDYPNIQFNSSMGVVASNSKTYDISMRKRNGVGIFVGPSVSLGYDFLNKTISPTVGISVGFGYTFTPKRFQWGK